ncbi:high mobility group B protein 3-like [Impatiens glandulifera]|uniref:high mobility group B protein 3-like n=1 Tax=Impatiens glandulifera TaxID=253017 RepID=UPI001FB19A10|nr:high mobility group B protein 3-like [Impatiens glandulifera]
MKGGKSKAESKKADAKLAVKKAPAKGAGKSAKAAKDPNKPKRPPSAFFVFMEQFRVDYKEKHPKNKSVSVVGKAAGEKWKSLSDAEKVPYVEKAEKRKRDYEKLMDAYNKKLAGEVPDEEEESDKSKSEVNDEDEDDDGSDEEEDDD